MGDLEADGRSPGLDRRSLFSGGLAAAAGAAAFAPAAAAPLAGAPMAGAGDAAWRNYLAVIDEARTKALASRWASTPQNRAQAMYFISMLSSAGR